MFNDVGLIQEVIVVRNLLWSFSNLIFVRNKVVISVIWKIGNSANYKFILDTPFSVMHARVAAILVKSPSSFSFSKLNKLKCELHAQTIAIKIKFNINPFTQINQCAFVLMV